VCESFKPFAWSSIVCTSSCANCFFSRSRSLEARAAVLSPGDALWLPAGHFLHTEALGGGASGSESSGGSGGGGSGSVRGGVAGGGGECAFLELTFSDALPTDAELLALEAAAEGSEVLVRALCPGALALRLAREVEARAEGAAGARVRNTADRRPTATMPFLTPYRFVTARGQV
jgi:hypothetical protein